jgi:cytosine/adenosine deaminase-related metal-dependent hydrolase
MKTVIQNCAVLDEAAAWGLRENVTIVIEGNRITSVSSEAVATDGADRVIDGVRFLAIPGLVNAHTHSSEAFTRGYDRPLPLEPWLVGTIWALDTLSERDHYLVALLGAIEMLQNGATSVLDHLGLMPGAHLGHLDATMNAYRDIGIRAGVAPLFREHSPEALDGQKRGHGTAETVLNTLPPRLSNDAILELCDAFFAKWHGAENGRLRCWIGPSGAQWTTIPFLRRCNDLARRHDGGLHMHLMETRVQDHLARQLFGKTAVAMLADEEILGPHVSLPHSVWITPKDIERIARAGAVPVHNPAANLRLGSGLSPIRGMLDAGVVPGLGADGSKSSDHQNLFGHLHLLALIHNLRDPDPARWITSREAVNIATVGGAAAMRRPGELGKIAPGYLADIALLDLDTPALCPMNDAFHHLAYSELGGSVDTVLVDGRVVVEKRRVLGVDVPAILAEVRESMRGRTSRQPCPPEWQEAQKRFLAYNLDILRNTNFDADEKAFA